MATERFPANRSYSRKAYEYVRAGMLSGALPAGTRLSDVGLARELGISRTPIREALNQLVSEQLAEQSPHYGIFVRKLTRRELEELYDLREMIEGYAACQAAKNRTSQHIAEMRAVLGQLRQIVRDYLRSGWTTWEGDVAERQAAADRDLHAMILQIADSPQTLKIAHDLQLLSNICGQRKFVPGYDIKHMLIQTYRQHSAILRSIVRQDSDDARQWMSRHIRQGKAQGLTFFDYQERKELTDAK